ncbi:MAG: T9SS type A sorting domain-containing protein, partial [Flavisolibacter sp.]
TFTLNIASAYSGLYELSSGCTDNPMVTVSSNAGDFVTGGGYIIPPGTTSCTGSTTSLLKGAPNTTATANGLKNNFGFNIKWNKSLKNLQGNWNTVIRATDAHRYQVKSSQPSSLAITKLSPTSYRADMVFGPVNFQDLSTGLWSDGGGSSRAMVTVIDNGEPGAGVDQIFISVYDKNGILWYSSNTCTNLASTKESTIALLNQGNIQIHNTTSTTPGTTRDVQTTATTLAQTFEVTATPNPSFSYFSLHLGGNNTGGLVNLKVTDVLGRVVESRQHLAPAQTLRIGSSYLPGIYIVEVQQGDTIKQLKLVKQ